MPAKALVVCLCLQLVVVYSAREELTHGGISALQSVDGSRRDGRPDAAQLKRLAGQHLIVAGPQRRGGSAQKRASPPGFVVPPALGSVVLPHTASLELDCVAPLTGHKRFRYAPKTSPPSRAAV